MTARLPYGVPVLANVLNLGSPDALAGRDSARGIVYGMTADLPTWMQRFLCNLIAAQNLRHRQKRSY